MSEFSSSESGFARFFGFGAALEAAAFGATLVVLRVVCLVAFGFAGAAAFLGAAFAFYVRFVSACEILKLHEIIDSRALPPLARNQKMRPCRMQKRPSSRRPSYPSPTCFSEQATLLVYAMFSVRRCDKSIAATSQSFGRSVRSVRGDEGVVTNVVDATVL